MAKDILVDTNSGDFLVPERDKKTQYWEVVWGKLFSTDTQLYMNIVVPSRLARDIRYNDDGEYVCNVHAGYYADASFFLVRLVTQNISIGDYIDLHANDGAAPFPSEAMYYPEFIGAPQALKASQTLLVDPEGYMKVVFKRFNKGTYVRAIICQGGDLDFKIGDGDSQSAQLLARCAPGKYYRFPTSGVDLTKYINSVVEHTLLTDSLVSEFRKDYKNISEASFDNSDGDLEIIFSGANEADDKDLSDPNTLDVELLRIADDDYIRSLFKTSQGILMDNEGFVNDIASWAGNLLGVWDINGECKLDKVEYAYYGSSHACITKEGLNDVAGPNSTGYLVSSVQCSAGKLYALNYVGNVQAIITTGYYVKGTSGYRQIYYQRDPLFMIQTGNEKYIDDDIYSTDYSWYTNYISSKNRRCFIPLKDCTAYYFAGSEQNNLNLKGCGVRPVADEVGNFSTVLALFVHPTTGKLYGLVSLDSIISEVKMDLRTNKLFVIKQSKK